MLKCSDSVSIQYLKNDNFVTGVSYQGELSIEVVDLFKKKKNLIYLSIAGRTLK